MSTTQPENIGESLKLILGTDLDPVARMPMLPQAFEQVAQLCAEAHSELPASGLQIRLDGIESGSLGQLIGQIGDAGSLGVLHAQSWDCEVFGSVDRALVFALVDMLLGGQGGGQAKDDDRAVSKIETNLVRIFFQRLADAMGGAFMPGEDAGFRLADLAGDIGNEALGGDSAFVVLAQFDVEIQDHGGQLRLIVPRDALDAMRQALSEAPAADAPAPDPGWRQHIGREFGRSMVTLVAVLDEHKSTLEDISALKIGQVMQLTATPKCPVRVECNGEPMFACRLGQSNGAYTLQVEENVDASQEFINDLLSA